MSSEKHAIVRVRHETKRRALTVRSVDRLTPNMVRVTLGGDDLAGFASAGFDDHVKLFFPSADGEPVMRDFTPRRYDAAARTLAVDFALHEAGPAADWAAKAAVGDPLTIGGPRGSMVVPDDFDWYLFIGDESALPAIGRRLEELRANVPAIVVGVVADAAEDLTLASAARLETRWVHRPLARAEDATPILAALATLILPEGDGYVWIAGEAGVAKQLRATLVERRGVAKSWLKAAGYWRRGAISVHEKIED